MLYRKSRVMWKTWSRRLKNDSCDQGGWKITHLIKEVEKWLTWSRRLKNYSLDQGGWKMIHVIKEVEKWLTWSRRLKNYSLDQGGWKMIHVIKEVEKWLTWSRRFAGSVCAAKEVCPARMMPHSVSKIYIWWVQLIF